MGLEEEKIPAVNISEPKPLSQVGSSVQMELEITPKGPDKKTTVGFKDKSYVQNIINTPKEGPSEPIVNPVGTGGSKIPPRDNSDILSRLGGDTGGEDNTPPDPEATNDGASMVIDGFDALFQIFIQIFAKDSDDREYQVSGVEKNKLKKYLSSIFSRAGTKLPIGWLFAGLFILLYAPIVRKAVAHRKLVNEEREKNKPGVNIISNPTRKRRRRRNDGDDGIDTPYVDITK